MKLTDKTKGILCILAAAFGFAFMTIFVRLAGDLPTMQKAFFRNFVALFVAVFAMIKSKTSFIPPKEGRINIICRCLFGTMGLIANFYAIDRIGIADANMLNKLSPFFAILLSIPLLKEVPSPIDIISTIIAFIGAIFIVRPTMNLSQTFPSLIGLLGGFGAGTAYVFVRRLGKQNVKTPLIVFYFSLFSSLITLPQFILDFKPMTSIQLIFLIMAGISASLGQFGITTAYKYAPAKEISVFDYTQVVFAAILGIFIFSELPEPLSIIGYILIIGVAIFRWKYNLKKTT
ncbi:MAG: DMT family transporter [Butyrivibrio sp.]|nr:DMT family transporter [Butyrivibrio sp.]